MVARSQASTTLPTVASALRRAPWAVFPYPALMVMASPVVESVDIVLLGSFNPQIFQPAWFAAQGLLSTAESQSAEIAIIHSQVVQFATERFEVVVAPDRFQVSTLDASSHEPMRDLAIGSFQVLSHTPIAAMGINSGGHYQLSSEDDWHRIGHTLMPPGNWEGLLKDVGMRSVVAEGQRPDGAVGYIRVTVEPSARYERAVYIQVNDHFNYPTEEGRYSSAAAAVDSLAKVWAESLKRSASIRAGVVGLV